MADFLFLDDFGFWALVVDFELYTPVADLRFLDTGG